MSKLWKNKAISTPKGFKIIPTFERYAINKDGEVFSLISNKMKKSWINMHGYKEIGLQNDKGKTVFRRLHVLLALTFIGPRPENFDVCHNDGNKLNNKLSNLRYASKKDNMNDKLIHGNSPTNEKNSNCILSSADVCNIKKEYKRVSYCKSNSKELAKKYGVSRQTITDIVGGRARKYLDAEILQILEGE